MLPPPSPLRTVRDPFESYGSSLSVAPYGTRLLNIPTLAVDLLMAIGVQQDTVLCAIRSTTSSPNDMMAVPPRQFGEFLVADRADPALCLPEVQQLPPPL